MDLKKIIIVLAFLSLPILSLNLQKPGENPWILRPFSAFGGFLQNSYLAFSSTIRGTTSKYINLIGVKNDIQSLSEKNQELNAKLLQFEEILMENQRLSQLLEFHSKHGMDLVPAKVISQDLFSERSIIRLNRGESSGIKKGMAVIHPEGAVGYILKSHDSTSIVLLLTDRYAVIDARVQRSRARGIVRGVSPNTAELRYLQRTDDVQIGDLVVSSGLDSIFPKGFPVATVENVTKVKSGITQDVKLKPVIEPSRLEEVFVVLNTKEYSFEKKEPISDEKKEETPEKTQKALSSKAQKTGSDS